MKHRIIKILITGGIITLSFALQSSFSLLNYRSVATPNLLLITTCIFGFMRGCNYGSVTGLFCGLLVDIFFGDVIGLYALIYMYVGFFGGLFKKMFYSDHVFMPLLLVFSGDFAYNMGCYTFRLLLRNKLDFSYYFWNIFFPQHGETVNIFFQSLTHFITGLIKSGIVNTSLQNNSDFHSAFTRFSLIFFHIST